MKRYLVALAPLAAWCLVGIPAVFSFFRFVWLEVLLAVTMPEIAAEGISFLVGLFAWGVVAGFLVDKLSKFEGVKT